VRATVGGCGWGCGCGCGFGCGCTNGSMVSGKLGSVRTSGGGSQNVRTFVGYFPMAVLSVWLFLGVCRAVIALSFTCAVGLVGPCALVPWSACWSCIAFDGLHGAFDECVTAIQHALLQCLVALLIPLLLMSGSFEYSYTWLATVQ